MKQNFINKLKQVHFKHWSNKKYAAFNSFKKIIKICTLAVAYSIIAEPTHLKAQGGDSTSTRIYELDEVTVQSTLIELKNAETGRSIEVINGSSIQLLPVTTIDELLRYVPGIDARQRGAFGTQTDFSIRGSNFNQVLVLIDGQKINDPLTSHFNSNIPISPSEIERIEIIRGPASAEYGPDATGGVINIITKTFSKNPQVRTFDANGKALIGQYNLINTDDGIFYGNDKFKLSGGVLLNKSDGNPLTSGLKGFFNINTVSLSGQLKLNSKWSASYRYAQDYRNFNAQWFYTALSIDSATEKLNRDRHQFQLARNTENSTTKINFSYISTKDNYILNSDYSFNNNTNLGSIQATHQIMLSNEIAILSGLSADQRAIESNNRGNHSLYHYGAFGTLSYKPLKSITINGGIRADDDESYGFNLLPQASMSYKVLNNLLIRVSAGRSIRAPDFTENYYNNYTASVYPGSTVGNRELKPEVSNNSELGFDYNLIPNSIISMTGFARWTSNQIDYVDTIADKIPYLTNLQKGAHYYYAINNSSTNTYGIDSRVSFKKTVSSNLCFNFTGGYTFTKYSSSFDKPSLYALLHLKHLINGEFFTEIGSVKWSINGLYKVRDSQNDIKLNHYLLGSYAVFNTSLDVAVYKKTGYLTLAVYNVFNKKYSDFLGAEMPGRWIAGGVKFKI